jgi:hypothetical protein
MHPAPHSTDQQQRPADPTPCVVGSAAAPASTALLSLAGRIGVIPLRLVLPEIVCTRLDVIDSGAVPFGSSRIPDPLPPRS